MPKTAPDAVMDAAFDFIDQADVMRVCSTLDATPTHAEIVTATLASVAITPNTDFTKAAGDTSGLTIIRLQNRYSAIGLSSRGAQRLFFRALFRGPLLPATELA